MAVIQACSPGCGDVRIGDAALRVDDPRREPGDGVLRCLCCRALARQAKVVLGQTSRLAHERMGRQAVGAGIPLRDDEGDDLPLPYGETTLAERVGEGEVPIQRRRGLREGGDKVWRHAKFRLDGGQRREDGGLGCCDIDRSDACHGKGPFVNVRLARPFNAGL